MPVAGIALVSIGSTRRRQRIGVGGLSRGPTGKI